MRLCRSILVALVGLLCAWSCTRKVPPSIVDVDPFGWYAPSDVSFEVEESEPECDMLVVLRYDNTIAVDSIELIVTTIAPDGVRWSEPLTIPTPRANRPMYTVEAPYRLNVEWAQSGIYRVLLHPQHIYKGVRAAGVTFTQKEI